MNQQYPSKLVERAVEQFSSLPGIGRKTALRLTLFMLSRPAEFTHVFADTLRNLRDHVVYCRCCHNISDTEICPICANPSRDRSTICVVQNINDVLAIENTAQYFGVYHVLGGVISPMDGVGPQDLHIEELVERVKNGGIKEVVLALGSTMEGDTTNFYIYRKLQPFDISISTIARGIAVGDEIEYADEITLGRSILNRIDFETTMKL
ncbi:recombinase RecR [Porphyromonas macacae]|uniref:recombination mediator RecR n=1 Tax=Porphyromonas macacae TaxID=28115 RepID=UPI00052E0744|nr:recombination mediator RecR [Porphyromonas macacae]KGN99675.1 recombinase RecR [Porphyromonas macacae]